MYNILISLAVAIVVTAGLGALLGSIWYGVFPGLVALIAAYIYLARRTMKQVEAIVTRAQQDLQGQNIDRGIEVLKEAYPLGKWQLFVTGQVDAQIGTVLYMSQRFNEAEPFLKRAFKKNWVAQAMLGTLYYKQKKYDKMEAAFKEAVIANKKESLLWNLYAYCMWKSGQRDKAIEVLNQAIEKIGEEKRTQKNLTALQNGRKMKMRSWNMAWYQFHLDRPPAQRQQMRYQRR